MLSLQCWVPSHTRRSSIQMLLIIVSLQKNSSDWQGAIKKELHNKHLYKTFIYDCQMFHFEKAHLEFHFFLLDFKLRRLWSFGYKLLTWFIAGCFESKSAFCIGAIGMENHGHVPICRRAIEVDTIVSTKLAHKIRWRDGGHVSVVYCQVVFGTVSCL